MSVEYRRQAACTGTRAHGHRDQPLQGQEVRSAPPPTPALSIPLGHQGQSPAQRSQLPDVGVRHSGPACSRQGQAEQTERGTVEHPRERMGQDTPALRYLDQVCRRSPSFLKVLLPMLLLHFEGEAGAQDPLGTGGDGVRGCRPRHRLQPGEMGTLPPQGWDLAPFSPISTGQEAQGPSPPSYSRQAARRRRCRAGRSRPPASVPATSAASCPRSRWW